MAENVKLRLEKIIKDLPEDAVETKAIIEAVQSASARIIQLLQDLVELNGGDPE